MMNGFEYAGMGMVLASSFRAAIYCRLSKDDDLDGESASIANQRDMLETYCEKQGWEVVAVYQDDGYTGLNMERPDLKRMLKAIERRQINLVITKDLSRLGRNYLQTGTLIEDFFPRHGVRYIAMNDGIDTMRDNNDIAPFKNILNEMYSKDISKKVHSSYLLKAQKGQFTGCLAPFGYRKDPEDKNHLLIDEETAPIVRRLFAWALEGHGPNYIRRRLEEEKIPCPTYWNRVRGLRNVSTKWEKKDPVNGRYIWDFTVIKDILMNPVYTGAIASQKKEYRFKIGTIGEKKPEEWIVLAEDIKIKNSPVKEKIIEILKDNGGAFEINYFMQFFDSNIVSVCKTLADNGIRVIVAGLDMDYTGKPFGPMPDLMAVAEYVTKVHAICVRCGNLAHHSHRLSDNDKLVMLGEKHDYEPICRHCFNELMKKEHQ